MNKEEAIEVVEDVAEEFDLPDIEIEGGNEILINVEKRGEEIGSVVNYRGINKPEVEVRARSSFKRIKDVLDTKGFINEKFNNE